MMGTGFFMKLFKRADVGGRSVTEMRDYHSISGLGDGLCFSPERMHRYMF